MALRFRFHPDDHQRYGDGWTVFDQRALGRLPVAELVEIEQTIGMSVRVLLDRLASDYADAHLAATWLARRMAGVTEDFADFNPLVLLVDWEPVPAGDADPPEPAADSTSSTPETTPA